MRVVIRNDSTMENVILDSKMDLIAFCAAHGDSDVLANIKLLHLDTNPELKSVDLIVKKCLPIGFTRIKL